MNDGPRLAGLAMSAERPARSDAIDFWRGFILCTIFVNHVPGNLFEHLTYRNFGLSDSAEAFVFISGMSLAIAYGSRFAMGRAGAAVVSLGRRVVRLYGIHIALSLAGLAIFAAGAAMFPDAGLMEVHGRDLAVDDPKAAFVGVLTLGHQFGYFNILPLYVLLVAAVPALLWLDRFGRPVMLGVSAAIYVVARVLALNIPSWPMQGSWFLDPFTWQFLLAIGLAAGLSLDGRRFVPRTSLLVASVAIAVFGLVVGSNGFGFAPGLYDTARTWCDLDKTMLGLGRLVHFLAVAYLVASFRLSSLARSLPIHAPLVVIGKHSLMMFALLSLLAAAGQVITGGLGHGVILDAAIVGGGIWLIHRAAVGLQRRAGTAAIAHAGHRHVTLDLDQQRVVLDPRR